MGSAHAPGQKPKIGARIVFDARPARQSRRKALRRHFHGRRTIRLWSSDADIDDAIDRIGHVPLPPYIKRGDRPADRERYQTVYAHCGAVAAPRRACISATDCSTRFATMGIERAEVTLHVGYGTFKPIRVERVEDHVVDTERSSCQRMPQA